MPLIKGCCCWNSVRKGSFASGIFTLTFYTVIFMTCAFHVSKFVDELWTFRLSFAMLLASGTCVVTSVLLIVGLCGDNRKMIIPWIISIFFTTILDFILFIYLMTDMEFNTGMVIFAISDLSIIVINICAMACVVSQYREYRAGRGQAGQRSSSKLYHDGRLALTSDCIGLKITADQTSTMSMSRTPNGGYLNIPPTPTRSTSVQ